MKELAIQAILLSKYGIETKEKLSKFISNHETQKRKLIYERNKLNKEKRRTIDETAISNHSVRSEISNCLSIIRGELKSFYAISARSEEIREKQDKMNSSQK